MLLSVVLQILLFLLNPFASAQDSYAPNAGMFNITSFYNGGSPHSIEARISFYISNQCPTAPFSNVYCFYSQSIQPSVATTTVDVICNDTSVFFGFQYLGSADNGYYLNIVHRSNGNLTVDTGALYMGDNVTTVVDENNPNGNFQMLVYDTEFVMGYNRVENCC